jgi:lia operon protein LiaF
VDRGRLAWDLKDESYVAFMGGVKLDLTRARIPEGRTVLDCTAFMGGIDIFVPDGIGLIMDGNTVLGGLDFLKEEAGGIIANKRVEAGLQENPDRVVVIRATAVMGGITVKRGQA